MQRKGNPLILLVGMHSGAVWRIVWKLLKKLKIELSFDLATPLLGIYPEKTVIQKGSVQFSLFITSNSLGPHGLQHARPPCPSPTPGIYSNSCPSNWWCHPTISSLLPPSPPAFNLSQHQGLFQWVSSSHQVGKVLQFQLQHQSFQWIFRTDFL